MKNSSRIAGVQRANAFTVYPCEYKWAPLRGNRRRAATYYMKKFNILKNCSVVLTKNKNKTLASLVLKFTNIAYRESRYFD